MSHADVIAAFEAAADPDEIAEVTRFYGGDLPDNIVMGVPHPLIFKLAKPFTDLSIAEIEPLLEDPR